MNLGGDVANSQEVSKKEEAEQRNREMRSNILSQMLDQDARARPLTKPEKAEMVENMIINMARSGRLGSKLNEEQLKQILLQFSSSCQKSTTVKFDRRRAAIDSDDEY